MNFGRTDVRGKVEPATRAIEEKVQKIVSGSRLMKPAFCESQFSCPAIRVSQAFMIASPKTRLIIFQTVLKHSHPVVLPGVSGINLQREFPCRCPKAVRPHERHFDQQRMFLLICCCGIPPKSAVLLTEIQKCRLVPAESGHSLNVNLTPGTFFPYLQSVPILRSGILTCFTKSRSRL